MIDLTFGGVAEPKAECVWVLDILRRGIVCERGSQSSEFVLFKFIPNEIWVESQNINFLFWIHNSLLYDKNNIIKKSSPGR